MSTTRRIARKAQTRKMANRHRTFRGLKHGSAWRPPTWNSIKKQAKVLKEAYSGVAVLLKSSDLPDDIF